MLKWNTYLRRTNIRDRLKKEEDRSKNMVLIVRLSSLDFFTRTIENITEAIAMINAEEPKNMAGIICIYLPHTALW